MTQSYESRSDSISVGKHAISGLGREAAWTYAGLLATTAGTLFITGFAVRRLGVDDFGLFALIAALALFLNVFEFALGFAVQRASAAEMVAPGRSAQEDLRREVNAAHSAYAVIGVAGTVVLAAGLMLGTSLIESGQRRGELLLTALFSGLSVLGSTSTSAFVGVLTGRREFRSLAVATVIGAAANVIVVMAAVGVLGLVGLALGQFASVVSNRIVLATRIRRGIRWFRILPTRPRIVDIRKVASFTLPLLVLSIGGHVITATDLIIVGSVVSISAVGLYRLGSLIPNLAVGVLYKGYDTVFPAIAGTEAASQDEILRFLTRFSSFVAGVAFGLLAFLREDIVEVVLGRASSTAASVLLIFCLVWIANVPVHGLALVLIARGRQRSFVPLVGVEVLANVVMTIVLTPGLGAIGAALATLLTLAVSNLFLLPILVRQELAFSPRKLVITGISSAGLGLVPAGLAVLTFSWMEPSVPRIVVAGAGAVLIGAPTAYFLLGAQGREMFRSTLLRRPDVDPAPTGYVPPTQFGMDE